MACFLTLALQKITDCNLSGCMIQDTMLYISQQNPGLASLALDFKKQDLRVFEKHTHWV